MCLKIDHHLSDQTLTYLPFMVNFIYHMALYNFAS